MLLSEAQELREKYRIIVKEEGSENEKANRIFDLTGILIMFETETQVGKAGDKATFGEFSRRCEEALAELNTLLED